MALSKKHYIAIAAHFKAQRDKATTELNNGVSGATEYTAISNALYAVASGMAADFYNDNIQFDRKHFLAACGF